jgi:acyl-CoA reductase-like NAD-dependent aldehyde dehydrogenase
MEDSRPAELKAPMQVDRREIGNQSGWGDLPPKEREQALQQIGREFPAHYRELIENYFRELANEPAAEAKDK